MTKIKAELRPEKEFIEQLRSDFDSILREELRYKGYNPDVITDIADLAIAYGSLKARRVESKPRTVHVNPDILINTSVEYGFENLVKKFENGENVNPHLSRLSSNIGSKDLLFYDWGINHFHLGISVEPDGFVSRTGPVAFAIVKENDVYIITVAQHGTWTDKSMLEIVETNWPDLLAGNLVNGAFEPIEGTDPLKALRKAHINMGITLISGHSYIAIGGGYSSNGVSSLAVIEYNRLIHRFKNLYKYLTNNITICNGDEYLAKNGNIVNVRLKRVRDEIKIYFEELQGEFGFLNFYPLAN